MSRFDERRFDRMSARDQQAAIERMAADNRKRQMMIQIKKREQLERDQRRHQKTIKEKRKKYRDSSSSSGSFSDSSSRSPSPPPSTPVRKRTRSPPPSLGPPLHSRHDRIVTRYPPSGRGRPPPQNRFDFENYVPRAPQRRERSPERKRVKENDNTRRIVTMESQGSHALDTTSVEDEK